MSLAAFSILFNERPEIATVLPFFLAAFAIVSVGIGFFTGKVSWGLLVGVAAGIAAIFGAPSIVSALSGQDEADCNDII